MPTLSNVPMPLDIEDVALDTADWTLDGQSVTHVYTPPTVTEGPYSANGLNRVRGVSVIKESGVWAQIFNARQARIDAAQDFLQGGYDHEVSGTTKDEIETDAVGGTFA